MTLLGAFLEGADGGEGKASRSLRGGSLGAGRASPSMGYLPIERGPIASRSSGGEPIASRSRGGPLPAHRAPDGGTGAPLTAARPGPARRTSAPARPGAVHGIRDEALYCAPASPCAPGPGGPGGPGPAQHHETLPVV